MMFNVGSRLTGYGIFFENGEEVGVLTVRI